MSLKLTKEIVNERLSTKDIELVGEYLGALIYSDFRCKQGHTWSGRPNNMLGGNGCPLCNKYKLSIETINDRLKKRGIRLIGNYKDSLSKSLFECEEGHIWEARVDSILNGTKCNICYPGGFKSSLPAWEYILKYDSFLKYGITNDLRRRLSEHHRKGDFELIHSKFHENGKEAQKWETIIKKKFGGSFLSKNEFPDGWTETLPLSYLSDII